MSNWFAQLVSVPGLAGLEAELNWFRQLVSPPPLIIISFKVYLVLNLVQLVLKSRFKFIFSRK